MVAASPYSTKMTGSDAEATASGGVGYMTLMFSVVLSFTVGALAYKHFNKHAEKLVGGNTASGRGGYQYSYVEIPNENSHL